MLSLKNIVKHYYVANQKVEALKGVDLDFRKNEFVSILGPSGCGKTTLLNIIGGLDRYTSGDLIINGVSTKEYKDIDWDIYRNNSIGFVFQNYNLISHQTVIANVELALTLSGISKTERKKRAEEVLTKVGLADQMHKKPNQISGGQMQRVAIARALINNPEILLADEPTGALDTETSLQIMELLGQIAKDRLVIMVTHNPDIAAKYSTRIIKLLDGRVIDDTDKYEPEKEKSAVTRKKRRKNSMSFLTALSLSFTNLLTKKTRTLLTAFAGSIGIIGIALILSLSGGMQSYIAGIERNTMSTYPLDIAKETFDMSAMVGAVMNGSNKKSEKRESGKIYMNTVLDSVADAYASQVKYNDLASFKLYLDSDAGKEIRDLTSAIQYGYGLNVQIYSTDTSNGIMRVNPSNVLSGSGLPQTGNGAVSVGIGMSDGSSDRVWGEIRTSREIFDKQYDIIAGEYPKAYNEVLLFVNKDNEILDYSMYSLGLIDPKPLIEKMKNASSGKDIADAAGAIPESFEYSDLTGRTFKFILNTDIYAKNGSKWEDKHSDEDYMRVLLKNSPEIKIAGIARPAEDTPLASFSATVGYTHELVEYVISGINKSEIVKEQLTNPAIDVFTGKQFASNETSATEFSFESLSDTQKAQLAGMSEQERTAFIEAQMPSSATYDDNLDKLRVIDLNSPSSVSIFPSGFEQKEKIIKLLAEYNEKRLSEGNENQVINYTDFVDTMMKSVSGVINIITYVLVAFVAISLVVSSIMIGIITYISVLERTKEIGILRSIGASKKDISRVFNAETVIVGLVAGTLGILITLLLNIPINAIIKALTGIGGIAALPVIGAFSLIVISVLLTVVAGLIPSRVAAKKDPVVALRTE